VEAFVLTCLFPLFFVCHVDAQVIGILIANLLGKPLGGAHSWRYLLGLCLIPSLLQMVMAATLLESPLWLLGKGGAKNRVHAEEVLAALRGTDDVEFDLECMEASVNDDEDLDLDNEVDDGRLRKSSSSSHNGQHHNNHNGHHGNSNKGSWADEEYQSRRASNSEDLFGSDAPGSALEKGSIKRLSAESRSPRSAALSPSRSPRSVPSDSLWAPEVRRPLLIGLGLQLVQQFSGINAVFFYSTAFFASARMSDPWLGSVLASTVNVLATGISIYLIERMGRRKLLLISTAGMMFSCAALTVALMAMQPPSAGASPSASPVTSGAEAAYSGSGGAHTSGANFVPAWWVGPMSVGMILVFVSFFEVGLGPIPWLIGAEIFPNRIRSKAMGLSSTLNWLSNFAVGLSFPSLSLALGPLSFVPFGVVLALAFVLQYLFVPETQGKSLEEIQEEFLEAAGLAGHGGSGGGEYDEDQDIEYGDEEEGFGDATPSRLVGGLSDESAEEHEEDYQQQQQQKQHPSRGASDTPATPIPEGVEDGAAGSSDDFLIAPSGGGGHDGGRRRGHSSSSDGYDDDQAQR
jgi:MFS family permease